jgi:membrane protein implicated in regulation of membrane protease activity
VKNEHSSSPMVWVHLGLTVVSAGLWLPVWLILWLREAALIATGAAVGSVFMWAYRLVRTPIKRLADALHRRPGG